MCANVRRCPAYLLKTRDYLCPTYSEATRPITVASVPIPENALSIRQNGQCSGDLRDGRQRSSASQGRHGATITPPPPGSMELVSYDFPVACCYIVSGEIDLRTMKRKRSKRKAVREDRPMLLSRHQSQVVKLMGKGLSRGESSDRSGVSRKCVSVFIARARGKFHLKTALQLRHLAFQLAMSAGKRTR